jgi:hypothetical protein
MKNLKQLTIFIALLSLVIALAGCSHEKESAPGNSAESTSTSSAKGAPEDYPMGEYATNVDALRAGLKSNNLVMHATIEVRYPNKTTLTEYTNAISGTKTATEFKGLDPAPAPAVHARYITVDGTFYNINNIDKTYHSGPDEPDEEDEPDDNEFLAILLGNDSPSKTGRETFNGFMYDYKEFTSPDPDQSGDFSRLYFDEKGNWVGTYTYNATVVGGGPGGTTVAAESFFYIKSISTTVPDALFNIPTDYTKKS